MGVGVGGGAFIQDALRILYSQKYWRELNLAVGPEITIARILMDLNLAARYRIAIRIRASEKINIGRF